MAGKRSLHDKMEAAAAYAVTGNSVKASELCGIPSRTIREWTERPYWAELVDKARLELQKDLDGILTGIIHKATHEIVDRINNGDTYIKKDQTLGKKPVSLRDVTWSAAVLIDKRNVFRGSPTTIAGRASAQDTLSKLKDYLSTPNGAQEGTQELSGDSKQKTEKSLKHLDS